MTSGTGCRRGKAVPIDSPAAKFLYTIIKQLDLKSVDWSRIATDLQISNGHAARMRFSRFKQQMEGTTAVPRGPRQKKNVNKVEKANTKVVPRDHSQSPKPMVKQENGVRVKQEPGIPAGQGHSMFGNHQPNMFVKQEPGMSVGQGQSIFDNQGSSMFVKREPAAANLAQSPVKNDAYMQQPLNLADIPHVSEVTMPAHSAPMSEAMMPGQSTPLSQAMIPAQSTPPYLSPYPPMTGAPLDMTMPSPYTVLPSPPQLEFPWSTNPHHVWEPVNMGQDDEGNSDDVLVKVEVPDNYSGTGSASYSGAGPANW
ncbi:hypothetical protein PHISCL_07734 [Aspergillus sclerotialis]|uniref:Myb-like DNA-binding domain-containing protein n=1 Tax=Aspergillus sclerotialis TaxID=2070753 RepID=A0A3A2ZSA7_9EURO|nr:hypothetical protein PHISCL_07734 [Aspergillus sclerotialis]